MDTLEKLEQLIIINLGELHKELFNKANKAFVKNGFPIQVEQLPVLMCIYCSGEMSQQEIANMACRDKSSVQRTITYLVKNNLAEVAQDVTDKRKNIVRLTKEGKALGRKIEGGVLSMEHKLFAGKISESEKKAFINQIKKIKNIIAES